MNRRLPPFEPPSRNRERQPSFPEYLAQLEKWMDRYTNYVKDYVSQLTSVVNTGAQGFNLTNIAADTIIEIGAYTTLITGTGTVSQINTSPGFSGQIHLVSVDGFSFDTLGNIAAAAVLSGGQSVLMDYNPVTALWYPSIGASGGGPSQVRAGSQAATLGVDTVAITFASTLSTPYSAVVSLEGDINTSVVIVPGSMLTTGFTAHLGTTPGIGDNLVVHYMATA